MNLVEKIIIGGYIGTDNRLTEEQEREVEEYNRMCLESIKKRKEVRLNELQKERN